MYLEERRLAIIQHLIENDNGSVAYYSARFGVSKETIRHDLNALAESGFVRRCHGGAILSKRNLLSELSSGNSNELLELLKKINSDSEIFNDYRGQKKMSGRVCVFGSFNVDIVAKVSRFPRGGESLMALGSSVGPGGKGTNQATAASKAGAYVHFVSKVGKDQFSRMASEHLTLSEIDSFNLYQSDTEPTGSAIIYVSQDDGENMIAIYSGANITVTDAEVQGIFPALKKSDILLVQLENNFEATFSLVKSARELGKKVILNPAPYSPKAKEFLPFIDIITPNETEASLLSGIAVTDMESAKTAAKEIQALGVTTVLITMGSKGALLLNDNKFHHIKPYPAVVVDTTGAGDAFNGALAATLASGRDLIYSASWASAFASMAVELEGASSMPDINLVNAKFTDHQLS
ncbi:TPA: PfkB family carbohydrate kinase [Escherichia coli]|uniref:PfkB family carbohydrate kinase n=2 Tax=Escherichia coli TaxID=562 RepID=UPI000BCFE038|nr:PfkB family carbohydrate kinase [Escherichia coli]EAZ5076276.1 DeoR family transcriptional regulator [Salmonella enterica]EBY0587416.1 DeoR family transcriptional regulator [Salmonella enterica subsp. enterica serovar Glostrup]EBM5744789.1 DeoR family transcriptional regulator [Salmonella enterica]EFM6515336.1 DeoR family transcriptional regulator [Escherichia coli]EFM6515641.1 DeoR family transcriptional regulator [Escherichia coli]